MSEVVRCSDMRPTTALGKFFKVRMEMFPGWNYPASQALTISNFAIQEGKLTFKR